MKNGRGSIEYKYREGKLKRTPKGDLKDLKPLGLNHLIFRLVEIHLLITIKNTCYANVRYQMTRLETRTEEFNIGASVRIQNRTRLEKGSLKTVGTIVSMSRPERW